MDTKRIVLEARTSEEFEKLRSYWYKKPSKGSLSKLCAEIVSPLVYRDYETLIWEFKNHPNAFKVTYNNQGFWERVIKEKINETVVRRIARIASRDRIKRGHVELKFRLDYHYSEEGVIKIVEYNNMLAGYHMYIPPTLRNDFTLWNIPTIEKEIYGLWVPIKRNL